MKTRQLGLISALAIAAWLVVFGDVATDTQLVEPMAHAASTQGAPPAGIAIASQQKTRVTAKPQQGKREPVVLALKFRDVPIAGANIREGTGDLFLSTSWAPPPPTVGKLPPPPPPAAPPLPFSYMGMQAGDGYLEVFLSRADQVFVVREHSVIEGTYRLDSIGLQKLTFTYLPLNQIQNLSLGATD